MPNMPYMQDVTGLGRLADTQQRIAQNRRADMGALQNREMNKITLANARQEMLQRESDNVWKQGLTQHMQQMPQGSNPYLHQRDFAMKTGRMDFVGKLDDQQFERIGDLMAIDPDTAIEVANNTIGVSQGLQFANTPDEGQWSNMYTATDPVSGDLVRMGQKPSGEWGTAPGRPDISQKSSPATDIDDYVADAEAQYLIDNPDAKQMPPGKRNSARREFKRAQAGEAAVTKEATETGKETAVNNMETHKSAYAASDNIAKIDDLIEHLGSSEAITGMGAELFKDLERVKTLFGSKIASIKVSDTETLDAMMGSEVFPLIKSLGIGARGMDTPAERKFLRQVMTGQIDLNKTTLMRMAKDRRKVAQRAITRYNTKVDDGSLDNFFKYSGAAKEKIDTTPKNVIEELPQGVTEDDITETMRANDMTREQVLAKLGGM